jgi:hypothetical protein
MSFVFLDEYLNGDYRRLRRRAGDDFLRREPMQEVPERTALVFRPPPAPVAQAVRFFRSANAGPALDVAFEVPFTPHLAAVRVELAAWEAPGRLGGKHEVVLERDALHDLGAGRRLGRVRFDAPAGCVILGMEFTGLEQSGNQFHFDWTASKRLTLLAPGFESTALALSDLVVAHEQIGPAPDGGLFDYGGIRVVPQVEAQIANGRLHLYFEVYPAAAMRLDRRILAITYRVLPVPPPWRFRDQFRPAARPDRPLVAATFNLEVQDAVLPQRLGIDVRSLEPGEYRMVVEVRDPADGTTASRATTFRIPATARAAAR